MIGQEDRRTSVSATCDSQLIKNPIGSIPGVSGFLILLGPPSNREHALLKGCGCGIPTRHVELDQTMCGSRTSSGRAARLLVGVGFAERNPTQSPWPGQRDAASCATMSRHEQTRTSSERGRCGRGGRTTGERRHPDPAGAKPRLSELTGAEVYLKREDLQVVRSYKLRGAYNLMSLTSPAERAAGFVCASAGNHAQGFAFACRALGVAGRIYLPRSTPRQKRDRIHYHGGDRVELILGGATYDDAAAAAAADVAGSGATLVPPFDDPRTIAGQGTVAREILQQLGQAPDSVIIPVGGGGLIAGMSTYLRERAPATRIHGVEPAGAPSMTAALRAGHPVVLDSIDPFVDGAAVRRVGDLTFALTRAAVGHRRVRGEGAGGPAAVLGLRSGPLDVAGPGPAGPRRSADPRRPPSSHGPAPLTPCPPCVALLAQLRGHSDNSWARHRCVGRPGGGPDVPRLGTGATLAGD